MAIEKTFFSYSRDDSEFVLKLAKDLRAAGANIWLDQLDIVAGKRWDAEIETALQNSQGQLVILSPSSVESNNVMDEVSFALENGKVVIPIIYKECQIPFRLKRLQYIDFTGDYKTAFDRLLSALNLETPQNVKSTSGTEDENKLNEDKVSVEEKLRQESEAEESLWSKSKSENTVSSYRHYLTETKLGKYKDEANKQITNIEKEAELKRHKESEKENERIAKAVEKEQRTSEKNKIAKEASILSKKSYLKWAIPLAAIVIIIAIIVIISLPTEGKAWEKASEKNTIAAYISFLKAYPDGEHKSEASRIRNELIEDSLYKKAKNQNTIASYESYLSSTPLNTHKEEAQKSINQIKSNKEELRENNIWMKADSSDIIWVIRKYINDHQKSKYRINAEDKLADLYKNAGINDSTDFVVCKSISNKNPRGIASKFNKGATVYAWASVRAPKESGENIRFDWLNNLSESVYNDKRTVSYNPSGYRVYSQYKFNEEGKYEVRLYNSLNTLIGSQTFTIK